MSEKRIGSLESSTCQYVAKEHYDAAIARAEEAQKEVLYCVERYRAIKLANTEMTRRDHVTFGKIMQERNRALKAVRILHAACQKVHDDEETGKWGPDITMKAVLAEALEKTKGFEP